MKISLACDHGALALKRAVRAHLEELGHEVLDFGTDTPDSCDYADFGVPAARAVASGECERGVVLCTTGIGMCITANKIRGIRAALCGACFSACRCAAAAALRSQCRACCARILSGFRLAHSLL